MTDVRNPALPPLAQLREVLNEARNTDDAERIHAALVEVVDGVLARLEHVERFMASVRSDLDHKQGIVTRINGGVYNGSQDNEPGLK